MPRRWQRSPRAVSFLEAWTPVGSPHNQSEVVAGEEEPIMAVAEVHERPATSPNSVSQRNSVQGKITSLQVRGGNSDARWRRPHISRVARGLVEGSIKRKCPLSKTRLHQPNSSSPVRRRATMPSQIRVVNARNKLRKELGDGGTDELSRSTMSGPME